MRAAVSYALFGWNKVTPQNCFAWETYLRGFFINVRVNRVLYPEWTTALHIDESSYNSPYKPIIDWLLDNTDTQLTVCANDQPLCLAMLWRLKAVFQYVHPEWKYERVICRDTDSVGTYREAQAVQQWITENKAVHCITDSVSHNIPLMGGMIGMMAGPVNERLKLSTNGLEHTWDRLVQLGKGIDFHKKGADQDFLMRELWPKVQDSVTEHYCLGMRHNIPEADGRHYSIPDIEIDVDPVHKFLNTCCGHIGSSGYYEPPMLKWLNTLDPFRDEYKEIEKQFPQIFFWSH
jgi:hypothetical protein